MRELIDNNFELFIGVFLGIVFSIITNLLIGVIIGILVFIVARNIGTLQYEYYIDESGNEVIIGEKKRKLKEYFKI